MPDEAVLCGSGMGHWEDQFFRVKHNSLQRGHRAITWRGNVMSGPSCRIIAIVRSFLLGIRGPAL